MNSLSSIPNEASQNTLFGPIVVSPPPPIEKDEVKKEKKGNSDEEVLARITKQKLLISPSDPDDLVQMFTVPKQPKLVEMRFSPQAHLHVKCTIQVINGIKKREAYTHLVVKGTKLTQDILKMLVQGFTHMKSLVVYKMKLSKEVFASNLLGHLTDLHIMECPEVTKHIGQMVKAAPQLTACTISKSKLTDEGCRGLLEGMKKLSFLDVSNNPITDLALYQFVQMESDLQELNISGCIDITDIGFGYAYSSLKKLKKITCLGCPEIIENKKAPSDPKIEVVFD